MLFWDCHRKSDLEQLLVNWSMKLASFEQGQSRSRHPKGTIFGVRQPLSSERSEPGVDYVMQSIDDVLRLRGITYEEY